MSDPSLYDYPSPLDGGWGDASKPLPYELNGKEVVPLPSENGLSKAYTEFTSPISNGERGGFDVHIYFLQTSSYESTFARSLHERIRKECSSPPPFPPLAASPPLTLSVVPELRLYTLWDRPIGPHPVAMFEVNVFTPAQFGAFVAWLVMHRGPLSALVHPNTDDEVRDHTQRATWLGAAVPLQVRMLREMVAKREREGMVGDGEE